tara:strand:- start:76 stop:600 length:525 start_codon:yes stop_codon:yes gene_type:complete
MKYLKIIVITFIVVFTSTLSKSETKVAFIELEKIIQKSDVGKSLIDQLNTLDKMNKKYFSDYKNKLEEKKAKIAAQKNILSEEEYKKKVVSLNNEFASFQKEAQEKAGLIKSKRNKAMNTILEKLNTLLTDYSNKNGLTFIIDQKNIVIGKSELNISDEVIKLLNQQLKKISIN